MSIYKDCDIRGIFGEEFGADEMRLIGRAIGRRLEGRSIVVAGDVRVSTAAIKDKLLAGLMDEGAHIIDIGIAPTPVAYFAKSKACFDAYALAIVTASHNPAKYNGIKLMFGDYPPTPEEIRSIEAEVSAEAKTSAEAGFKEAKTSAGTKTSAGAGLQSDISQDSQSTYEKADVEDRYTAFIRQLVKGSNRLKVVLDIGNGTTAGIAPKVYRAVGYEVVELFGEADGRFPNRNPNPADFKNLDAVRDKVVETGADFGVAFDGDGDRAVFIDNMGRAIINEKSLIMLTEHATGIRLEGAQAGGFSVVYDQKCSKLVPDAIEAMGGEAILERSGHAFIKKTFLQHRSLIAGEISGHFFFKELGHDDGIYAGLCMGDFIAESRGLRQAGDASSSIAAQTLADLADRMPDPFISPDLRYRVPYGKMDEVLYRLKKYYEELGMPISTYDGVRVSLPDGWLLVRKSVTEEAMTAKVEAGSMMRINEIIHDLERNYFESNL